MLWIQAVVHTSTAYANCDRTRIVESIYPPPVQPQKLIDALELVQLSRSDTVLADG